MPNGDVQAGNGELAQRDLSPAEADEVQAPSGRVTVEVQCQVEGVELVCQAQSAELLRLLDGELDGKRASR